MYTLFTDHRKVKVTEDQLNTKSIGQVFGFFPDSIFLICDDGKLVSPSESGIFTDLRQYYKYEVIGESVKNQPTDFRANFGCPKPPSMAVPVMGSFSSAMTAASPRPRGISIKTKWPAKPPGVTFATGKEEWTKNVEVCNYSKSLGTLRKISNFPITLTESTSSIKQVSQQLSHEAFGGQTVILLDNDNLKIPDTTASRGIICMRNTKFHAFMIKYFLSGRSRKVPGGFLEPPLQENPRSSLDLSAVMIHQQS